MNQKNKNNYSLEEHFQQIEECFDTSSDFFAKMMSMLSSSKIEKPALVHHHHIVPRSYFQKKKIKIDNSEQNIAIITPYEHCIVHYYAWKCAKPLMRRSMASAFHFMVNTATKDIKCIPDIAVEYAKTISLLSLAQHKTKDEINSRMINIGSTFRAYKTTKEKIFMNCVVCGHEKIIKRQYHRSEVECKICKRNQKLTFDKKYILVFAIDEEGKAVRFTVKYVNDVNAEKPHTKKTAFFSVQRYIVKERKLQAKKWSVVGTTDEWIDCPLLRSKLFHQELLKDAEEYRYFYNIDPSIANWLIRHNAWKNLKHNGTFYFTERNKHKPPLWLIEEFDDAHTRSEWEDLLGLSWITISKKYRVSQIRTSDMLDSLYKAYKEDPSVMDRLTKELKLMKELNQK